MSYPPRIWQSRVYGKAERARFSICANSAKSPLWEGWEGPGFLSTANRAKSPLWEGWERPGFLSAANRAKSPLWEGWDGQVSYPPRIRRAGRGRFPIRREYGKIGWEGPGFLFAGTGQVSYPPQYSKIACMGGLGRARFPNTAKSAGRGQVSYSLGGARFLIRHE